MTFRICTLLMSSATLAACSVVSLKPAVQSASLDYATVFEEFSNKGLLRNILRASEGAPLNFADLPALHGAMSVQASLGLTAPFGSRYASSTRDGLSAGLNFSSSPTFDTSPLNTSGFSLEILQPISPTFVVAAWQSGVSKELLLRLFVESIEFTKSVYADPVKKERRFRPYNDPRCGAQDATPEPVCKIIENDFTTLLDLIQTAIASGLDLRLFTILAPLGHEDTAKNIKAVLDTTTATGETDLHVGNGDGDKFALYRTLPEVALGCLNGDKFNKMKIGHESNRFTVRDTFADGKAHYQPIQHGVSTRSSSSHHDHTMSVLKDYETNRPSSTDWTGDISLNPKGSFPRQLQALVSTSPKGAASASPKTSTAPLQQSQVQQGQVSSIAGDETCLENPIVLPLDTEMESSRASKDGIIIHWRSIASVLHYVGQIVAEQGVQQSANFAQDTRWSWQGDGTAQREVLFAAFTNPASPRVSVSYQGALRGVQAVEHDGYRDDSLIVMSLLTQLLNDSRIAGDIPVTQRLEVVP